MNSITIEIAAKPDRVWGVMFDVENWPAWTPSVRSVRLLDRGPLTIGSRVRIQQPKFPPAVWRITQIEPGRRFTWESAAPGLRVVAIHTIIDTTTGSRVTLTLEYHGLFGQIFERMTWAVSRRYLEYEASGLKQQSESSIA
jgi:uncharacterized membrane protein